VIWIGCVSRELLDEINKAIYIILNGGGHSDVEKLTDE
jgi:hypothetical protein